VSSKTLTKNRPLPIHYYVKLNGYVSLVSRLAFR